MQEKIEKIFSYFGNIKNQPFYTSCISQVIQIYEANPQSLKFILYNLNQLIFSTCKQVRLRLKHRLITASLISKLNKIYCQRVKEFLSDKLNFELESFQLDTQANQKTDQKVNTNKWEDLDIFQMIQTEKLLFSTRGSDVLLTALQIQQEKKVFDSFLDMNHATMLNIENSFKDVSLQNQITDQAIRHERLKYKTKVQKITKKGKQHIDSIEFVISNPFNLMYQICVNNLLHTQWELRHLAVLILKQLLLNSEFLGFNHLFKLSANEKTEDRFLTIASITKDALKEHLDNNKKKRDLLDDIIYKNITLLALDRFADYQTDESVILIRMVSAQILSICFRMIQGNSQTHMIKMLRRVFDKQTPFMKDIKKFTWEVKHSFLYFLTILLKEDRSHCKMVCQILEQCLIKMLANDQVDQITLCICKILQTFVGEKFFTGEKIDRTNRQIWSIVQNLDDISISAKDTLRLLLLLFPYFKLNQGNCIDRLKKFFVSKISEVRHQLYKLIASLYGRKKQIDDSKIVERNLVQLLQGALIEYEIANFQKISQAMPEIMPYIIKSKNVRKIVQFINTCVTPQQYTEEIINSKFYMGTQKQKSEFSSNEYMYIIEHENVHCPINAYTDKRIWKMALTVKQCFRNSTDGLQQLLRGIQKNNQKNHRGKLLVYLLLNQLLPKYRKDLKLFDQYQDQAAKLILLQFNQVTDNQIQKFYLLQLQKTLKSIVEDEKYSKQTINKQALEAIGQIYEAFKKSQSNSLKNGGQIAKKLSYYYSQPLNPVFLGDIQMILRILNNIMKIQRELVKNVKILALHYLIEYNKDAKQIQNLNVVIKAIMDAIKEDTYNFISEATAKAAAGLSMILMRSKKIVYTKFNNNLCFNVSTNYQPTELNMKQIPDSIKLEGSYMKGMCHYIQLMGNATSDYLKDSWKFYLQENPQKAKNGQISQQYNRLLTLLSGTVTSLLKIDTVQLDQEGFFINKLTTKISQIIKNIKDGGKLHASILIKIKKIVSDTMRYLSTNYCDISNIFFEWFLQQMRNENIIIFEVLQKVSGDYVTEMAPIASLFILQIIKSITKIKLHDVSMNSLSNLIVGVYTNITKTNYNATLRAISDQGKQFIKNFKNTSNFNYPIKVKYNNDIILRSYQIQGITWIGFLTKYNLSGALCDDMGLGKTLQTLTVIENEYINFLQNPSQEQYLHSLIICPNTLMQHWAYEYLKYFQTPICQIVVIDNKKKFPLVKSKEKSKKPILFITGYGVIQKNDNLFENLNLKFLILDEGHLIKNVKTIKYKAIKKLNGLHRFILTGTPIQNRLIELWGLFDFLMPGYLYSQELFKKHYEKLFEVNLTTFKEDELLFSDEQRRTLQKLHYKVMPFIMRRMKSDVLKQLPQKIINDYYCTLSDCQMTHYEALQERIRIETETKTLRPLANLHQMIKIANHPYLAELVSQVNWEDSGKFVAMGQLFQLLGFVNQEGVSQNKILIFAKQKATVDLIERYLKQVHSSVKFLKLTADVKQSQRFTVAQTYNGDSDIKILIVTKAIGGIGLNLTSANCVIMFDSDYNPTVDMQAIDRAHRIGQKRVLNVYRLITKDTLEEKIMGIQKFKTNLANSIVNMDNSSIKNLKDSKLPDLLENVRDLRKDSRQSQDSISKTMYSAIVAQLQKNAIQTNEFLQRY